MINSTGLSIIDFDSIAQYNINSDVDAVNLADTTSNFTVNLKLDWINNYERISVGNLVVPKSYYVINSTNNTFKIRTVPPGNEEWTIELDVGNFSYTELINELNIRVEEAVLNDNILFSYSTRTGKITVDVAFGTAISYYIWFTNSLYEVLGGYSLLENPNNTRLRVNPGVATPFPYVANLNAFNNMYLLCDMVSSNNSQTNSNILASLYPHNAQTWSYSVENYDILQNSKKISKRSNTINFQIVDQFKNLINFNGIACSFTLYLFKLKS
jgi:hypothetical protein